MGPTVPRVFLKWLGPVLGHQKPGHSTAEPRLSLLGATWEELRFVSKIQGFKKC